MNRGKKGTDHGFHSARGEKRDQRGRGYLKQRGNHEVQGAVKTMECCGKRHTRKSSSRVHQRKEVLSREINSYSVSSFTGVVGKKDVTITRRGEKSTIA